MSNEAEVKEAIEAGADVIVVNDVDATAFSKLAATAKELSSSIAIECSGKMTAANVREYAEAGAQIIRVEALTSSAPAVSISFRVQPF